MKKIGIFMLVLLLALGSLGVGYASWNQTLQISSNVGMATMAAEVVVITSSVPDPNGPHGPATCTVSRSSSTGAYYDTLNIEIASAYPGYNAVINYDIKNIGTMPFYIIDGAAIVSPPPYGASGDITVNQQVPGNIIESGQFLSGIAGNYPQVSVFVPYGNIPVQGGTYNISIPLTVHQFN